jgi:hypothetical protein
MSADDASPSENRSSARWASLRAAGVCILALAALLFPRMALPAAFLTFLAYLSLPSGEFEQRRIWRATLLVASIASGVALVRFVAREALPGMVAGGNEAQERSAIARLREILFAEDLMRTKAYVDPDHDGVGSAGRIDELAGTSPVRGGRRLQVPPLNPAFGKAEQTRIGPALQTEGYLFVVCVPKRGGGFTARPSDAVDEEKAERRFIAYAWPAAAGRSVGAAYAIDEHERILESSNVEPGKPREPHYASPGFPPPCNAAVAPTTRNDWKPWKGKKPRRRLPGDKPASSAGQP